MYNYLLKDFINLYINHINDIRNKIINHEKTKRVGNSNITPVSKANFIYHTLLKEVHMSSLYVFVAILTIFKSDIVNSYKKYHVNNTNNQNKYFLVNWVFKYIKALNDNIKIIIWI